MRNGRGEMTSQDGTLIREHRRVRKTNAGAHFPHPTPLGPAPPLALATSLRRVPDVVPARSRARCPRPPGHAPATRPSLALARRDPAPIEPMMSDQTTTGSRCIAVRKAEPNDMVARSAEGNEKRTSAMRKRDERTPKRAQASPAPTAERPRGAQARPGEGGAGRASRAPPSAGAPGPAAGARGAGRRTHPGTFARGASGKERERAIRERRRAGFTGAQRV